MAQIEEEEDGFAGQPARRHVPVPLDELEARCRRNRICQRIRPQFGSTRSSDERIRQRTLRHEDRRIALAVVVVEPVVDVAKPTEHRHHQRGRLVADPPDGLERDDEPQARVRLPPTFCSKSSDHIPTVLVGKSGHRQRIG